MIGERLISPTRTVSRAEWLLRLQEAIKILDPMDREILSLDTFEELTATETARVLGIEGSAGG